jgi:DNA-binding CsgD family transcriptional regulator/PAS domain-containing protein
MRYELNDVLVDLYSCASSRERFPLVLDKIAARLRVRSAMVQLADWRGGDYMPRWTSHDNGSLRAGALPDACMPVGEDAIELTPATQPALDGMCVKESDLFLSGTPALRRLHERLHAAGLGLFMGSAVRLSDQETLVLALHRHVGCQVEFGPEDKAFVESFMPHLRQAIQLADRFEAARVGTEELKAAIDRLRCGVLICDAESRPCWWNAAAESIFERRDCLWVGADRLLAGSTYETEALRRLIADASHAEEGPWCAQERCLVLRPVASPSAVQVLAVPLSRESGDATRRARRAQRFGRVMLLLSDASELPSLPEDLVARLFGLSPVESRLTVALCRGLTLGEYARIHGVSVGTARFQLKQILWKTGASRQSHLVRQVYLSVIAQTHPVRRRGRVEQRNQ